MGMVRDFGRRWRPEQRERGREREMISREEGELDLVINEEDMMAVRYRETDAQEQ